MEQVLVLSRLKRSRWKPTEHRVWPRAVLCDEGHALGGGIVWKHHHT
eukprot:CAMPEP_0172053618 /NCGR_PEP_ID=MMETSP1043-20130122/4311_1 /TAXON_ID=464988 /ORGANISM="Hemiselmis andersenii, Strain CCMP441" /LENGTH=46 /DNA_ID= /DNA_START= /DNA_END= /DNA_ORIENTATION=